MAVLTLQHRNRSVQFSQLTNSGCEPVVGFFKDLRINYHKIRLFYDQNQIMSALLQPVSLQK